MLPPCFFSSRWQPTVEVRRSSVACAWPTRSASTSVASIAHSTGSSKWTSLRCDLGDPVVAMAFGRFCRSIDRVPRHEAASCTSPSCSGRSDSIQLHHVQQPAESDRRIVIVRLAHRNIVTMTARRIVTPDNEVYLVRWNVAHCKAHLGAELGDHAEVDSHAECRVCLTSLVAELQREALSAPATS